MRADDLLRLSIKDLFRRFSQSVLTFITIILLSVTVIVLGNFLYNFKRSADQTTVGETNKNGITLSLSAKQELENQSITDFIAEAEKLGIADRYAVFQNLSSVIMPDHADISIKCNAMIAGLPAQNEIVLAEGEIWSKEDDGMQRIWLAQTTAEAIGAKCGDALTLSIDGETRSFVVKGITADDTSYLDYRFLSIRLLKIQSDTVKVRDLTLLKRIDQSLKALQSGDRSLVHPSYDCHQVNIMQGANLYFWLAFGICGLLILISMILCLSCVINSVRISTDANARTIGIYRAIGMRRKSLYWYVMIQIIALVVIASVVAVAIAWPISALAAAEPLSIFLDMIFLGVDNVVTLNTFAFWMPLINFVVLCAGMFAASAKIFSAYDAENIADILKGEPR